MKTPKEQLDFIEHLRSCAKSQDTGIKVLLEQAAEQIEIVNAEVRYRALLCKAADEEIQRLCRQLENMTTERNAYRHDLKEVDRELRMRNFVQPWELQNGR